MFEWESRTSAQHDQSHDQRFIIAVADRRINQDLHGRKLRYDRNPRRLRLKYRWPVRQKVSKRSYGISRLNINSSNRICRLTASSPAISRGWRNWKTWFQKRKRSCPRSTRFDQAITEVFSRKTHKHMIVYVVNNKAIIRCFCVCHFIRSHFYRP